MSQTARQTSKPYKSILLRTPSVHFQHRQGLSRSICTKQQERENPFNKFINCCISSIAKPSMTTTYQHNESLHHWEYNSGDEGREGESAMPMQSLLCNHWVLRVVIKSLRVRSRKNAYGRCWYKSTYGIFVIDMYRLYNIHEWMWERGPGKNMYGRCWYKSTYGIFVIHMYRLYKYLLLYVLQKTDTFYNKHYYYNNT